MTKQELIDKTRQLRDRYQELVPDKAARISGNIPSNVKAECDQITEKQIENFKLAKEKGFDLLHALGKKGRDY